MKGVSRKDRIERVRGVEKEKTEMGSERGRRDTGERDVIERKRNYGEAIHKGA